MLSERYQGWSLLKVFALIFAATWTCFIAAVGIPRGSASTDRRLAVIRGPVFVGIFAPALVALVLTAGAQSQPLPNQHV